jgi:capsular exopolysaccharide synthesis family protein
MENTVFQPKEKPAALKATVPGEKEGGALWPVASGGAQILPDPNYPLVLDHTHVVAAESFSILRSRLLNVHAKLGTRSVLITSAEAGDGKTLIATNLALSLGQLGSKRILLVDGDLRAASASRLLKLRHLPGLGEFLQNKKSFETVVHPTGFPSLSVTPAGLVPEKSLPEMLEGSRWPEFLELAKQKFDIIVVDCLPVAAPVADLELLMTACDAFLFVVHMRQTHRQGLVRVGRLDQKKFLGVILNNADAIYDYDYNYYYARTQNGK